MDPDPEALEEDLKQYGPNSLSMVELNGQEMNRPQNEHRTLPFNELCTSVFDPLINVKAKKVNGGRKTLTVTEQRRIIVQSYIAKWRNEVGDDFYPVLRLMLPEKDRDRAMYGLKEAAIGKLIVKLLKISAQSEDGFKLVNWKKGTTDAAGDFPQRCYEALTKRAMRQAPGDMSIAELNVLLDELSRSQKEETQLPIFEKFYQRMNAKEMKWLIQIILRQMKLGVEKSLLNMWHPDGEAMFGVSSSLKRVCWELTNPESSSNGGDYLGIELMQCFQPQLAQFQPKAFPFILTKMGCTDSEYWIEEKLDGERMQMHMVEDENQPGGKRFAWWSRKAKEYTYLYGQGFEDDESALTRHMKDAFNPQVRNIILDGEMITWDPVTDKIVGFGTLKSAALSEQRNPGSNGQRPVFRVFDCLYLNDSNITRYTLEDRRLALCEALSGVPRRIEIHKRTVATKYDEIEEHLRKVVSEASEGLVLKNPKSVYRLNSRNDDWMKVKPEYMTEFGENLDCVVIGGYYGSGKRGGALSSFLCGLRVGQNYKDKNNGTHPEKCVSFFKVGGGFRTEDYAAVRHITDGKWIDWDSNNPPNDLITLGGNGKQYEKPDVYIKPSDSLVLEVKAASVSSSDQFALGLTLRFPRFKRVREDKSWETALSVDEFMELKKSAEEQHKEHVQFEVEQRRKLTKKLKKEIVIAGSDQTVKTPYAGPKTQIFEGLNFCVLSDMITPPKKRKVEIEQILKANGGNIFQSPTAKEDMICIGDRKVVKVGSLIKGGQTNIVKAQWVLDALKQSEIDGPGRTKFIIPFEPSHMFHLIDESAPDIENNVDRYGDSYCRDISPLDLKALLNDIPPVKNSRFSPQDFLTELEDHGRGLGDLKSSMFRGSLVHFATPKHPLSPDREQDIYTNEHRFEFAGGNITNDDEVEGLSHYVVVDSDPEVVKELRQKVSGRSGRLPKIVGLEWITESWKEETLLDEDRFIL